MPEDTQNEKYTGSIEPDGGDRLRGFAAGLYGQGCGRRTEFIRRINAIGCELLRHGKHHDIYINKTNGKRAPIPRHKEIADTLMRIIVERKYLNAHYN